MNSLRHGVQVVSSTFIGYCQASKQSFDSIVLNLKDLRNNPDVFQKVCQVAFATIQYVNWQRNTQVLSKFTFALSTANMHDFYSIFKLPRTWLFPVTADAINANAVLDALQENFSDLLDLDEDEIAARSALRTLAQGFLKAQLESMAANNDAYRNTAEFVGVLQRRIQAAGQVNINVAEEGAAPDEMAIDLRDVDLEGIIVPLYHPTLAEKLMNWTWTFVDVGCVGLYLQGWNLVDTAKWADRMGQYPATSWVRNHTLEAWVRGAVCGAFLLKLFEATRKLSDEQLTPQAKQMAKWDRVTAAAELVFNGAGYLNHIGRLSIPAGFIHLSAIVAKSLGILSLARRPRSDYFARPEAPAAL